MSEAEASSSAEPSFPRFPDLPIELRLKIWKLALFPRIYPVHIRAYGGGDSPLTLEHPDENISDTDEEEGDDETRRTRPNQPIAITTCSQNQPCGCDYIPPRSHNIVPPPAVFSVCRESRKATLDQYSTIFNKMYNIRGQAVLPPALFFAHWVTTREGSKPYDAAKTGIYVNSAVDMPLIRFNVASSGSLDEINHFISIATRQDARFRRVLLRLHIALPPYQWWQRARFQRWRRWGESSDWVPKQIVKCRELKEVILLVEGKVYKDMLPKDWRERTVEIWERELRMMRSQWPEEWDGEMPILRFVTRMEDV